MRRWREDQKLIFWRQSINKTVTCRESQRTLQTCSSQHWGLSVLLSLMLQGLLSVIYVQILVCIVTQNCRTDLTKGNWISWEEQRAFLDQITSQAIHLDLEKLCQLVIKGHNIFPIKESQVITLWARIRPVFMTWIRVVPCFVAQIWHLKCCRTLAEVNQTRLWGDSPSSDYHKWIRYWT